MSQIRSIHAVRRKKKPSASLFNFVFGLLISLTTLWVFVAWSYYHVATQQEQEPVVEPPIKKISSPVVQTEAARYTPVVNKMSLDIVEQTKLEQHPDATHAKLLSKTGNQQQLVAPPLKLQTYPPIDSVVTSEYNVTGDVSFMVDFAIVGFPKCGTSTMMEYLDQSPHTKVAQKERCELGSGRQAKLIRELYEELPEGNYKRGIKCPRDLENEFAVEAYTKYFPNTHFLIGLRHPVLWFESFYNFRVYNNNPMRPAAELVGNCGKGSRHVCTHRARFHQYLANLGKTRLEGAEKNFFAQHGRELRMNPVKGNIFLYHVEQLRDDEPTLRQLAMRKDLTTFLGLPEVLPPMKIWRKPGKNITQVQRDDADSKRLDICNSNHTQVRIALIEQAKMTAEWILQYFLKSNDVYV